MVVARTALPGHVAGFAVAPELAGYQSAPDGAPLAEAHVAGTLRTGNHVAVLVLLAVLLATGVIGDVKGSPLPQWQGPTFCREKSRGGKQQYHRAQNLPRNPHVSPNTVSSGVNVPTSRTRFLFSNLSQLTSILNWKVVKKNTKLSGKKKNENNKKISGKKYWLSSAGDPRRQSSHQQRAKPIFLDRRPCLC